MTHPNTLNNVTSGFFTPYNKTESNLRAWKAMIAIAQAIRSDRKEESSA